MAAMWKRNYFSTRGGHFSIFWRGRGAEIVSYQGLVGGEIIEFDFRKNSNMRIQEDFSGFSLCKEAKLAMEYKNLYKIVNLTL